MNRFLRVFLERGKDREFAARVVCYADDFVILSRGRAEEALTWTRRVMTTMGLSLNETKTCTRNAREEHFAFLGYTFGPERYRKDGHWYLAAKPSKKSVQRLKGKVRGLLRPGNQGTRTVVVRDLNRQLRGWVQLLQLWDTPSRVSGCGTTTSTNAYATFSGVATRCPRGAPAGSTPLWSSGNWGSCGFGRCTWEHGREPVRETSRRAGCGKSARPVR